MPSLLSRLRNRAIGSTVVSTSTSSDGPMPIPRAPLTHPSSLPIVPAVDRKILTNPNDFFDNEDEEKEEVQGIPMGLLPSPRKSSSAVMKKLSVQEKEDGEGFLSDPSVHGSLDPKSNRNRPSDIANPSKWSTFGRQKEYSSPTLGDFGQRIAESTEAATCPPSASTAPQTLSHSSSEPSQKSKKDISPSDTISSQAKSSPKAPLRPQSASSSFFGPPSPRLCSMGAGSSMTFGYPETRTAEFNLGSFVALDEFGRFHSPHLSEGPSSPPSPIRSHNIGTYPPHGHSRSSQMDDWKQGTNPKGTSSSFPQVFSKSLHRRESLSRPKAQKIFNFERDIAINADAGAYATASPRRLSLANTTPHEDQRLREMVGDSHQGKGDSHGSDGLVSRGMEFKFDRGRGNSDDRTRVGLASHANRRISLHSFPSLQSLGGVTVQGEQKVDYWMILTVYLTVIQAVWWMPTYPVVTLVSLPRAPTK